MAEIGRRYNPKENKPNNTGKRKMDKILNVLIGVVVVLILIVAGFIVIGGSNNKESANNEKVANNVKQDNEAKGENIVEKDSKEIEKEKADQAEKAKDESNAQDQTSTEANQQDSSNSTEQNQTNNSTGTDSTTTTDTNANAEYNYEESKTAKTESSSDQNVSKVVTDSNWKPTKTTQKDDGSTHVSSYDKNSLDWKEKIATIATTTGLDENDMIVWYVKNGGSPDTSIGIVSSKDKKKNYRVSLKWVPNEGWEPTKLEVLNSYKGAY